MTSGLHVGILAGEVCDISVLLGLVPSVFKCGESFVGELHEFLSWNLQVMSLDDRLVHFFGDQPEPCVLVQGRSGAADEAPSSCFCGDDALVFQFGVGLGDRVPVHP